MGLVVPRVHFYLISVFLLISFSLFAFFTEENAHCAISSAENTLVLGNMAGIPRS